MDRRCAWMPESRAVSPALAGMDPARDVPSSRFPRTRGDAGDFVMVSPALAGMDRRARGSRPPGCCFPRTRGDGPSVRIELSGPPVFPPHSRGWTRQSPHRANPWAVSPALAGMDLIGDRADCDPVSFPRTRGDGPRLVLRTLDGLRFPPHSRGWTRSSTAIAAAPRCFPRTRGDGPACAPDFHCTR